MHKKDEGESVVQLAKKMQVIFPDGQNHTHASSVAAVESNTVTSKEGGDHDEAVGSRILGELMDDAEMSNSKATQAERATHLSKIVEDQRELDLSNLPKK